MPESAEAIRKRGGVARRRAARLAAVQALYQADVTGVPAQAVLDEFLRHRFDRNTEGEALGEADRTLFADLVRGTWSRRADIDHMLSAALVAAWPLDRLDSTLRAILRAGSYELLAHGEVPAVVVINEYVELAHAFFGGKEPGLVNGVLDRLARRLREHEMQGGGG
jgi:N utilization substance protein B